MCYHISVKFVSLIKNKRKICEGKGTIERIKRNPGSENTKGEINRQKKERKRPANSYKSSPLK